MIFLLLPVDATLQGAYVYLCGVIHKWDISVIGSSHSDIYSKTKKKATPYDVAFRRHHCWFNCNSYPQFHNLSLSSFD